MNQDLIVVGAGRLGREVLKLWREQFPDSAITAETRASSGQPLSGVTWRLRAQAAPASKSYLLFSVPPSATEHYADEARRALTLWNGEGRAVFTSSTAALKNSDRGRRLQAAEQEFLTRGGTVVRLAGLYSRARGPQRAYATMQKSEERGDAWLNLIEETDAAELCRLALTRGERGEIYIGCDGTPITRQTFWEMVCDRPSPFHSTDGDAGQKLSNDQTREKLQWQPRYSSFVQWWANRSNRA